MTEYPQDAHGHQGVQEVADDAEDPGRAPREDPLQREGDGRQRAIHVPAEGRRPIRLGEDGREVRERLDARVAVEERQVVEREAVREARDRGGEGRGRNQKNGGRAPRNERGRRRDRRGDGLFATSLRATTNPTLATRTQERTFGSLVVQVGRAVDPGGAHPPVEHLRLLPGFHEGSKVPGVHRPIG